MHHLHPLWPWSGLRRALYVLLLLLSETRRPLLAVSPSASAKVSKTRMEIREHDFSFSDGARERPVIEVVTKDVRTADIFNLMQAVEDAPMEEATSWWKDAVTEEFSRQDVVVLALITLCVLRLTVFVLQVTWKLVKLPMQWYAALDKEEEEEEAESRETRSEKQTSSERKQLAIVRFCHLQFLLVVEKLKREMRGAKMEATQQMVATLDVVRHEDGKEVTLAEILATLRKIQAKDSSFKASEVEEHLQDIKQDVDDEGDAESGLQEAWTRLQEIYASFLRIQATIIRRQQRKKNWEWQMKQHEQHHPGTRRRQRRLPSSEDPTDEVLLQLQELTKELPQGFTSDMFTSLGNAMHENVVAAEPETSPVPSPQMETKPALTTHTSIVCAEAK
ncbi:hypothetical protein PR003_g21799 [Phytophthora rubi]|uniref:Uncharacterized protein n=1 Tax=Phytophthora rubi TaxID=129364 RepID=A0A6A3JEQ0_9STRA|nr:hypothetical protein PR002_g21140 [Phytophthora rubi]KAE8993619.1 hypothetical protein PR001_g20624 [Phytophthora rubi]KAE9304237.1 hypothetical protein PR003_g21799 [Phytophthora rubi]